MTREREREGERERERENEEDILTPAVRRQTCMGGEGGGGLLCASSWSYCCTPTLASTLLPAMAQGTRKT
jgi:hypothetical protein